MNHMKTLIKLDFKSYQHLHLMNEQCIKNVFLPVTFSDIHFFGSTLPAAKHILCYVQSAL